MNTMCDKELLVGYLYDELDAAARAAFEAHAASCAECRDEVKALGATRAHLTSWAPPEPDFGFRIVRGAAAPPERRPVWKSPLWGLAAAALLVLAVASAIAQVEVRYGQDGLVIRTGWARSASPTLATALVPTGASAPDLKSDLSAIEQRLVALEQSSAQVGQALQSASSQGMSEVELLRRVKALIAESEARQQREATVRLAAGLSMLSREIDRKRNADLATVQRDIQGATDATVRGQSGIMNYLRVISQQGK